MELLCVPGAGGSARAFRPWVAALAPELTVRPLNLPGRGRDTPVSSLVEAATRLMARIPADEPYALAGHSMGALIAYELTRQVCAEGTLAPPKFLVVAAARPPHLSSGAAVTGLLDAEGDEFLDGLVALGFAEPAARNSPMRALFVPTLREDLRLLAGYQRVRAEPLPVDLLAWHGLADPSTSEAVTAEWAGYTSAGFAAAAFDGGHSFPFDRTAEVAERLRAHLNVH